MPLLGELFWVVYGDSYVDIDFAAVHKAFLASKKLAMMTVLRNDNRWDRSNVIFRDGQLVRYDKKNQSPEMNYVDYGVALLRREAVAKIPPARQYDLADLYTQLVSAGEMGGYEVDQSLLRDRHASRVGRNPAVSRNAAGLPANLRSAMSFTTDYLAQSRHVLDRLDPSAIDRVVARLVEPRRLGGRIFFLGVGGSAANAAHAVNDFRKLCNFEAYAPTDNVAELTARTNDDGWETVFVNWLRTSRLRSNDLVFVLSVGGGDLARNISPNLVRAVQYAKQIGAPWWESSAATADTPPRRPMRA